MKKGKNRAAAAVELAAVLLATAAAFAWGQRAALIERGYTARGGEYMLLLIPAIYYAGKQVLRDWIAELRSAFPAGNTPGSSITISGLHHYIAP